MRASSSTCHGKVDWVEKEVHSGSRVVTVIGGISVAVGLGLGRLVDHMSAGIVSSQELSDHRLVAVLSWTVVVIVKGRTSVHESINEK